MVREVDLDKEVLHPKHYEHGGTETIEIIERVVKDLPADKAFMLGNVIKYCLRCDFKGSRDADLEKARNYAHRLVYGRWADK